MIKHFCAGGLVFYHGKLVVLKRFNGVWLFPKGHIDPGETAPTAAIREVAEECGLSVQILESLGETSYRYQENEADHDKIVQWFLMEAISETIMLEQEFFKDVQLISEDQIGVLSFPDDRELAVKGFQLFRTRHSCP
jgi:8-oxo-dGTP pyrophosphatase MutT (NUDIX family)